jgi:hypothetical protein
MTYLPTFGSIHNHDLTTDGWNGKSSENLGPCLLDVSQIETMLSGEAITVHKSMSKVMHSSSTDHETPSVARTT